MGQVRNTGAARVHAKKMKTWASLVAKNSALPRLNSGWLWYLAICSGVKVYGI